jgi:hypothetical protein
MDEKIDFTYNHFLIGAYGKHIDLSAGNAQSSLAPYLDPTSSVSRGLQCLPNALF